MKKLFFIFSLVVAIFLGGLPADAETSSKHQTAKTHRSAKKSQNANLSKEFGPNVFFRKDGCYQRNVLQTLSSLGFKKESKSKWVKDGFIVSHEYGDYTITFPNQDALKKFINQMEETYGMTLEGFESKCGIQCLIEGLELMFQALP